LLTKKENNMCITIDYEQTMIFKKKYNQNHIHTFNKIIEFDTCDVEFKHVDAFTPFQHDEVTPGIKEIPEQYKATLPKFTLNGPKNIGFGAFHMYTDIQKEIYTTIFGGYFYKLPVKVVHKDVLCIGKNSEIFEWARRNHHDIDFKQYVELCCVKYEVTQSDWDTFLKYKENN